MKLGTNSIGTVYFDGQDIIKQGTIGNCLYVIQKGKVAVIKESSGKEIKVAELNEKDFFGEMGLFEKDVRSCTIRSVGQSTILTIDKRSFYKIIQNDPSIAFNLLEKMSQRLRKTTEDLNFGSLNS
ncbi:MAG TPA: cyclic nucleotide-binding domain-containing protein [Bacteroidales bacterium]